MRLGVVIERKNHYRLLAPVVEAALGRGWDVTCFHDYAQPRSGMKGYEFPHTEAAPSFRFGRPRVEAYYGLDSLPGVVEGNAVIGIISLRLPPRAVGARRGMLSIPWVVLQYQGVPFTWLGSPDILSADGIGIYSDWWLEATIAYFYSCGWLQPGDAVERELRRRAVVVGFPELDQVPVIEPNEVRRRLGLPADRPIVLFLPYPFRSNVRTPWARWAYAAGPRWWRRLRLRLAGERWLEPVVSHGWDDPALVRAIRAFCDSNDALLVVKAREKDPVPGYLERLADLTLYDQSHYPPTILDALAVSSLCIHFYSTAVLEAVGVGVPSLSICPSFDEMGTTGGWERSFYTREEGSLFQFRGIAQTMGIGEAIETLPRRRLADFVADPAARESYTAKFLGFLDGKSADRLLDLMQSVVGSGL